MATFRSGHQASFDLSALLNQLQNAKQLAQQADGAVSHIGAGGAGLQNLVTMFGQLETEITGMRASVDGVKAAMGDDFAKKFATQLDAEMGKVGTTIGKTAEVIRSLSNFKIGDFSSAEAATTELKRLMAMAKEVSMELGSDFKIDMNLFDKADISTQFSMLLDSVKPMINNFNLAIGQVDFSQLALNIKSGTKKAAQELAEQRATLKNEIEKTKREMAAASDMAEPSTIKSRKTYTDKSEVKELLKNARAKGDALYGYDDMTAENTSPDFLRAAAEYSEAVQACIGAINNAQDAAAEWLKSQRSEIAEIVDLYDFFRDGGEEGELTGIFGEHGTVMQELASVYSQQVNELGVVEERQKALLKNEGAVVEKTEEEVDVLKQKEAEYKRILEAMVKYNNLLKLSRSKEGQASSKVAGHLLTSAESELQTAIQEATTLLGSSNVRATVFQKASASRTNPESFSRQLLSMAGAPNLFPPEQVAELFGAAMTGVQDVINAAKTEVHAAAEQAAIDKAAAEDAKAKKAAEERSKRAAELEAKAAEQAATTIETTAEAGAIAATNTELVGQAAQRSAEEELAFQDELTKMRQQAALASEEIVKLGESASKARAASDKINQFLDNASNTASVTAEALRQTGGGKNVTNAELDKVTKQVAKRQFERAVAAYRALPEDAPALKRAKTTVGVDKAYSTLVETGFGPKGLQMARDIMPDPKIISQAYEALNKYAQQQEKAADDASQAVVAKRQEVNLLQKQIKLSEQENRIISETEALTLSQRPKRPAQKKASTTASKPPQIDNEEERPKAKPKAKKATSGSASGGESASSGNAASRDGGGASSAAVETLTQAVNALTTKLNTAEAAISEVKTSMSAQPSPAEEKLEPSAIEAKIVEIVGKLDSIGGKLDSIAAKINITDEDIDYNNISVQLTEIANSINTVIPQAIKESVTIEPEHNKQSVDFTAVSEAIKGLPTALSDQIAQLESKLSEVATKFADVVSSKNATIDGPNSELPFLGKDGVNYASLIRDCKQYGESLQAWHSTQKLSLPTKGSIEESQKAVEILQKIIYLDKELNSIKLSDIGQQFTETDEKAYQLSLSLKQLIDELNAIAYQNDSAPLERLNSIFEGVPGGANSAYKYVGPNFQARQSSMQQVYAARDRKNAEYVNMYNTIQKQFGDVMGTIQKYNSTNPIGLNERDHHFSLIETELKGAADAAAAYVQKLESIKAADSAQSSYTEVINAIMDVSARLEAIQEEIAMRRYDNYTEDSSDNLVAEKLSILATTLDGLKEQVSQIYAAIVNDNATEDAPNTANVLESVATKIAELCSNVPTQIAEVLKTVKIETPTDAANQEHPKAVLDVAELEAAFSKGPWALETTLSTTIVERLKAIAEAINTLRQKIGAGNVGNTSTTGSKAPKTKAAPTATAAGNNTNTPPFAAQASRVKSLYMRLVGEEQAIEQKYTLIMEELQKAPTYQQWKTDLRAIDTAREYCQKIGEKSEAEIKQYLATIEQVNANRDRLIAEADALLAVKQNQIENNKAVSSAKSILGNDDYFQNGLSQSTKGSQEYQNYLDKLSQFTPEVRQQMNLINELADAEQANIRQLVLELQEATDGVKAYEAEVKRADKELTSEAKRQAKQDYKKQQDAAMESRPQAIENKAAVNSAKAIIGRDRAFSDQLHDKTKDAQVYRDYQDTLSKFTPEIRKQMLLINELTEEEQANVRELVAELQNATAEVKKYEAEVKRVEREEAQKAKKKSKPTVSEEERAYQREKGRLRAQMEADGRTPQEVAAAQSKAEAAHAAKVADRRRKTAIVNNAMGVYGRSGDDSNNPKSIKQRIAALGAETSATIKQTESYRQYADAITQIATIKRNLDSTNKDKWEQKDIDGLQKATDIAKQYEAELATIIKQAEHFAKSGLAGTTTASRIDVAGFMDKGLTERQALAERAAYNMMRERGVKGAYLTKGATQINEDPAKFISQMKDAKGNVYNLAMEYDRLNGQMLTYIRNTQMATPETGKWASAMGKLTAKIKQYSVYFGASTMVFRLISAIREGINDIKEFDRAMVELKKVTDETSATYKRFADNAAETSARIGTTIIDLVNSTADFARLGYSMQEAARLAEAAGIYMNVADGIESIDVASEDLISTMKAFGIEAPNAMGIVDKFNETGNNFAISSAGVGEALKRSAAALAAAGNDINESIGLVVAANTVVQDPDVVGTALKTLSMRLRGTKTEMEEAGLETDGMAESISQLRDKLLALSHQKVDILEDNNTYKDTTEIIREMAGAWSEMTDMERAAATELMGGKRQGNILSSMIENWDVAEEAINGAMNAEGSAVAENEKYLDSIEGKTKQFTNAVQVMWKNLISSDLVKFIIDVGTGMVHLFDTWYGKIIAIVGAFDLLTDKVGVKLLKNLAQSLDVKDSLKIIPNAIREMLADAVVFPENMVADGIANAIKNSNLDDLDKDIIGSAITNIGADGKFILSEDIQNIDQLKQKLTELGADEATTAQVVAQAQESMSAAILDANIAASGQSTVFSLTTEEKLADSLAAFGDAESQEILAAVTDQTTLAELRATLAAKGYTNEEIKQILTNAGLIASNEKVALSFGKVAKSIWKAAVAFITSPFGKIAGIAAIIGGVIGIISLATTSFKESKEQLDKTVQAAEDAQTELKKYQDELDSVQSKIDDINSKGTLSVTDEAELKRLTAEKVQLEEKVRLEKEYLKLKNQQAVAQALETSDKDNRFANTEDVEAHQGGANRGEVYVSTENSAPVDYALEQLDAAEQAIEQAQAELDEAVASGDEKAISQAEANLQYYKDMYRDTAAETSEIVDKMQADYEGVGYQTSIDGEPLSEEQKLYNERLLQLQEYIDRRNILIAKGSEDPDAVNGAVQSAVSTRFTIMADENEQAINDMIDAGASVEEVIDQISSDDELTNWAKALGINVEDVVIALFGLQDAAKGAGDAVGYMSDVTSNINTIDSLADSYKTLQDAVTEFNTNGALSAETLNSLINNNLLQYLTITENGIAMNASALVDQADAAKYAALQSISFAMAQDMNAIASGNLDQASAFAQQAVTNMGNAATVAAQKAQNATVGIDALATSMYNAYQAAQGKASTKQIKTQLSAVYDAYQGIFNAVRNTSFQSSVKGKASGSGSGSGSSASKELIDWIEHYYEPIERAIDEANARLENKLASPDAINMKNTILDQIIDLYGQKTDKIEDTLSAYEQRAAYLFSKFSKDIQDKIKNGSLNIDEISDKDLKTNIDNYFKYIESASKAKIEIENLKKEIADAAKQKLDNISTAYENEISLSEKFADALQGEIDLLETRGEKVGVEYYKSLIENSEERISLLQSERNEMQAVLDEAVKRGQVAVGSEQWYDMVSAILEVDASIQDSTKDIEDFKKSIRTIRAESFDQLLEKFERLNEQLDFLFDRLTDDDSAFDENGWTDKGIAALGMLAEQMELARSNANECAHALEQLERDYKSGVYSEQDYAERKEELLSKQRDEINKYESAKDAIVDLNKARIEAIKDGINKEIDAYKKLVDKKKELLNAEKELYNYQKDIQAKQKNIALLKKQIAALSGSTSAEDIAERIRKEAELAEAKQELDDTTYEHSIDVTNDALDKEVDAREKQLEQLSKEYDKWLDDRERVISESLNTVKQNTETVLQQISDLSVQYGLEIAPEIIAPWKEGENAVDAFKDAFAGEGMRNATSAFEEELSKIKDQWETNAKAAEDSAKRQIAAIQQQTSETVKAYKQIETAANSASKAAASTSNVWTSSSSGGGDGGYIPSPGGGTQQTQEKKWHGKEAGRATKDVLWDKYYGTLTMGGVVYYKFNNGTTEKPDYIYFIADQLEKVTKNGKVYYKSHKGQMKYKWDYYAKGTKSVNKDKNAIIDELGEELVLHAGENGRLQYLSKGTGVIPADMTENLMKLAELDPRDILARNKPTANLSPIVSSVFDVDLNIAEVVHVDHVDNDTLPDLTKAVKDQLDKYMKQANQSLKRYTR